MSIVALDAARLIDMLPEDDKNFAYEFIKKLVLAWDPDFTKVTSEEAKHMPQPRKAVLLMKRILIGVILPHCSKSKDSAGEKISCVIFLLKFIAFSYIL